MYTSRMRERLGHYSDDDHKSAVGTKSQSSDPERTAQLDILRALESRRSEEWLPE